MPYYGYYGLDIYYIILVVPCAIFAMWAQWSVSHTFKKYEKVRNMRGITGAMAAEQVLRQNGVFGVRIERVSGRLSDHYDPRTNVIRLSDAVYDSVSVSAVGVAAHEAGHAVQYALGYKPIHLRAAIVPMTQIGSNIAIPLLLLGIFVSNGALIYVGIAAFGLSTIFQLITLPVELNASKRALVSIQQGEILSLGEYAGAKKVLTAAAMTYVAALASSVATLLRLILQYGGRRRR